VETHFLARGLIIGFSIAATVGPICLLCIQRTLTRGHLVGLVSGLGAASADAFYGAVAGFGLTSLSSLLVDQEFWFRLIGGSFLVWLGVRTVLTPPATRAAQAGGAGLAGAYGSTLLLTLTNPLTILSFTAIFAGLGVAETEGNYGAAAAIVFGVFAGSAVWWVILSGGVTLIRGTLTPAVLRWVNRVAGVVITGAGLLSVLSLG
jgi:threonine/homoserine/homoserine lactone efflux protein